MTVVLLRVIMCFASLPACIEIYQLLLIVRNVIVKAIAEGQRSCAAGPVFPGLFASAPTTPTAPLLLSTRSAGGWRSPVL
jgi:hypothetical protein